MDSTPGLGVLRDAGGVWTPPSACYPSPRARPLGSEPPSGLPVPARVPSSGSGAGPFPRRAAARRGHPCPRSRLRLNALSGLRAPKMGSAGAVLASGRRCGAPARPSHPVLAPLLAGEEFLSSHSGPWAGLPHWGPFRRLQPQVPLVRLGSLGRSWCLSRTGRRSAGTGPHLAGSAGTPPGPSWLPKPGLRPRAPAPAAVLAGAECPSSFGSVGRSWCLSRTGRRSAGTGPHLAGSAGTPPGPSWLPKPGLRPRAPAPAAVLAGAECPSSFGSVGRSSHHMTLGFRGILVLGSVTGPGAPSRVAGVPVIALRFAPRPEASPHRARLPVLALGSRAPV